jgi:hypothetical protein
MANYLIYTEHGEVLGGADDPATLKQHMRRLAKIHGYVKAQAVTATGEWQRGVRGIPIIVEDPSASSHPSLDPDRWHDPTMYLVLSVDGTPLAGATSLKDALRHARRLAKKDLSYGRVEVYRVDAAGSTSRAGSQDNDGEWNPT